MRTRRANRAKSYVAEKYDFDDSSEDEKPRRRAKKADERDENFTADDALDDVADEPSNDEELGDAEPENEPAKPPRPARRAVRGPKPAAPKPPKAKDTGYLDINLFTTQDGSLTKGYAGLNDRTFRGQPLVNAWYGPIKEQIAIEEALWDRWEDWPALPPKQSNNEHGLPSKGAWLPDFATRQDELAKVWRQEIEAKASQEPSCQALSEEEAMPYRMPHLAMPVLLGPRSKHETISFEPGMGFALSQAGIPYDIDESSEKSADGWIIDTGGLVVSMDWAPRPRNQTTQLLALAVRPHADQKFYDYEIESARENFLKHGTVQLWELQGEKPVEESTLPTTQPPRLRSTLCLDYGRARRVKWNSLVGYLAVLCGDGKVYVFDADRQDKAAFGMCLEAH
jgi:transcription factor C subunit 6